MLYRRWPRRDDLLLAALQRSWWQPIPIPDTGSLREDAIGVLRNANASRSRMATLLIVQLMDYFRQTGTSFSELRTALRDSGQPTGVRGRSSTRAVARGEVPDVPRPARLVDLPFELFRHDLIMTMRPMPDEAIVEIVDEIWLPLLRP